MNKQIILSGNEGGQHSFYCRCDVCYERVSAYVETECRQAVRWFREHHETGTRIYRGQRVECSTRIQGKRVVLKPSPARNKGVSAVLVDGATIGDSNYWPGVYANLAEIAEAEVTKRFNGQ
jgi:hypothetical protein